MSRSENSQALCQVVIRDSGQHSPLASSSESSGSSDSPGPPPRKGISHARQAILQAVGLLEQENDDLRAHSNQVTAENDRLKRENDALRRELEASRQTALSATRQVELAQTDNRALQDAIRSHQKAEVENRERQNTLQHEKQQFAEDMEEMRVQLQQKDTHTQTLQQELDALRKKLDRASRRNFNDRDVELMHEVEVLKSEKNDILMEKDDAERVGRKMRHELQNLETQLGEKCAELKNEQRRHSLLTKEFNSLLEENNHLKLQLRRRQGFSNRGSKTELNEEVIALDNNSANKGSTRENTLVQTDGQYRRERTLLSRDTSRDRSRDVNTSSSESSYRQTLSRDSSRQTSGEGRPRTQRCEIRDVTNNADSTRNSSPDSGTLPSLTAAESARGGRWRP